MPHEDSDGLGPPPWLRAILLALCSLVMMSAGAAAQARQNPVFQDSDGAFTHWSTFAAEGVEIAMTTATDPLDGRPALRLDYNFRLGSGYAGIRRTLDAALPSNYELSFDLRSDLPDNNLETKLVSPDGLNVWWVNRRAMQFPRGWTKLSSRARHFEFAWGPSGGAPLEQVGTIEIVVASAEGGKGTLWLRDIEMHALPTVLPSAARSVRFAPSSTVDPQPQATFDADPLAFGPWSAREEDPAQKLEINLINPAEIGGLDIRWTHSPASTLIESSLDGTNWKPLREVRGTREGRQFIRLGEFGAPWLRLSMTRSGNQPVGIERLSLIPVESAGPTQFASYVARNSRRGLFPRGFVGEQSYWTVIGLPDGPDECLVSEDGAVEVGRKDFSIEPFLELGGDLLTWADSQVSQSLEDGYIPVPTVTRRARGLALQTTAFVDATLDAGATSSAPSGQLFIRYRIHNESAAPAAGTLLLAARPFQVNPPTQWLNLPGGAAIVRSVRWNGSMLSVNEGQKNHRSVLFPPSPAARRVSIADVGDAVNPAGFWLPGEDEQVVDSQDAASAAAEYRFSLVPGELAEWWLSTPLTEGMLPTSSPEANAREGPSRLAATIADWRKRLSSVRILLPKAHQDIADTARSTLAYILINKDGPGIQPGSRNYERSWIRDGSLTSAALLAFGEHAEVRKFIEWYAPRQFDSGAVPCVVDRRGPDPVPEHDSHGELIWLIWNYYHHTGDLEFLRAQFPHIQRAATHIQNLRLQRLTDQWLDSSATRSEPGKPPVPLSAFAGLVPESISHEGYSSKPMHSYWDDAFCLRGLLDAASAARALGESELAARFAGWADDFSASLERSIIAATTAHGIDYLPGCVELGDFDPTSTTVSLWPCRVITPALLPLAQRTFDRNWQSFQSRRDQSPPAWKDYTPYELRQVGSYVLLGQPDRAAQVLDFHMRHRRPSAWNLWAEVVRPDLRTPGFVGDMPHTWCGSDFLNSLRTMFLYEREDGSLVLMGGIPPDWLDTGEVVGVEGISVPGGALSVTMQRQGGAVQVRVGGDFPMPQAGVWVQVPAGCNSFIATIDGKTARVAGGAVRLDRVPALVVLTCQDGTDAPR